MIWEPTENNTPTEVWTITKEWDKQYWIEGWAQADMDYVVKRVQDNTKKRDAVIIYSGDEGTGKTTLATQHSYYVAWKLELEYGLKNFYFSPTQIYDAVMKGDKPPGTPFIYDEGITGLLAKTANSKDHVKLQIMFSTCRSKRYPIFICIPRFRELPDWMAIDRSISLYKTYTKRTDNDPEEPGFYKAYNKKNKRTLYLLEKAKKYLLISKNVHSSTPGYFSGFPFTPRSKDPPFSIDDYEEYKRKSLMDLGKVAPDTERDEIKRMRHLKMTYDQISFVKGVDRTTIMRREGKALEKPVFEGGGADVSISLQSSSQGVGK